MARLQVRKLETRNCDLCMQEYTRYPDSKAQLARRSTPFSYCSHQCQIEGQKQRVTSKRGWFPSEESSDPREVRFSICHRNMKRRCNNPKDKGYSRYGGRGISVCKEWFSIENFTTDMWESFIHHYDSYGADTALDRIDNDGNYEPSNCRWVTYKENNRNRAQAILIPYNGKEQTAGAWGEELGMSRSLISNRYFKGYPIEQVFTKTKFKNQTDSPLSNK